MASSDPLSSPSPSPPPSNLHSRSRLPSTNSTTNKNAASQQLDTSSELSELTDDDVEGDKDKVTPPSEDDDDDPDLSKVDSSTARPTPKASRRRLPEHKWDWTYKRKRRKITERVGGIDDDPEEEEEEEGDGEGEGDEEEEEDEEEQLGVRRPINAVRAPRSRDVVNDDAEEEEERDDDDDVTPRRRRRVARAESLSDSAADDDGESETGQGAEDDVLPPPPLAPTATVKEATPDLTDDEEDPVPQAAEADDVESENETASEEDDPEVEEGAMDVDEDAPEPPAPTINGVPAPIPTVTSTAPPASQTVASIMGTTALEDAPSPSASPSPSPLPEDAPDADAPEPEDAEAEDGEVEDEAADAETEADLQHEHRAEALDTLATIELKFALLRERVYVEKMEALAWEEALVANGSHPELLYLHSELSRRRDKRMELAARRRNYEVANILKRRHAEENAVWSWWMLARDELQTTMIAETNRKRRKLERDRRAAERPQPVLRLPPVPHEVVIPPTLYEIVNKNLHGASSSGRRSKDLPTSLCTYPSLSSLSSGEITHDIDYLLNHRWPPEPPPSRYESFAPAAPPNMSVVLDVSSYGRPPAPAPPPRRRYPPGPSGLQHELEHSAGPFSRPLTPHGAKVNGWMPSSGGSRPGDSMYERDERDREDIEMERAREREREIDYLVHKQQQQPQPQPQQAQQQQPPQQQQIHYTIQQPSQQPPQQPPTRPLPHSRSDSHVGPGQGPPLPPSQAHHPSSVHHHHHLHYHHVHHHHHSSSSAPPPSSQPPPPISPLHTPYDGPRIAPPRDMEHPRAPAAEVINLPGSGGLPLPPRQWDREREPPSPRYRDRERDRDRDREREREREQRERDRGRPASGPPPTGPHERIMTPFSAPLPPPAPRSSRGSFSDSGQSPLSQPPPPASQHGGTPLGSPVRTRALPGRMVSPVPLLPPPTQPVQQTPVHLLHPIQGQVTMSPPKVQRMPPPPVSPSAKPMDGERERERVVLPPPLPPPSSSGPVQAPVMSSGSASAHAHAHRLPLLPPQGQGQVQPPPPPTSAQPPPSVPVAAGEGA
ncbi:Sds3-like-domain-containing protein [Multifurca ochricompacta]|uniref:Sds3-like-domain-containing protein n=1 Tax=Multifurca ochricompacta TaxID=376703 RepID=A0AAD4M133_9AGAM|nr:Sds3-like-domain-containing protein [Multifurca ochricompacta]